ncbi:MAG: DUF2029 domain-containing protein [Rhodospirillaceae bacterium]|nr:DUF2029 domain-containing protein [Rhodospirillaceae bacterium]
MRQNAPYRNHMGPLWLASLLATAALLVLGLRAWILGDPHLRGHMIGFDFVNLWSGAHLAHLGAVGSLFDFDAYNQFVRAHFGAGYPLHLWSYPPHFLTLIYPLAAFDYFPALLIWSAVTLLVFVWGLRQLGFRGSDLILLALGPATAMNIFSGQTGLLAAGLLFAVIGNFGHRPWLAGICAGLLTIKPQLGLLVPLLLLVQWQWRVVLAGALTLAVLVSLSLLWFGSEPWQGFRDMTLPLGVRVMLSADMAGAIPLRPGWGTGLQLLGLPVAAAFAIQSAIAIALVAATLWLMWWRPRFHAATPVVGPRLWAPLLMATLLVTPYLHNYDLTLMAPVVLWCWRDPALAANPSSLKVAGSRLFLILAWLLPWIVIPFNRADIPIGPAILTGLAFWTMLALYQAQDRAAQERSLQERGAPGQR